MKIHVMHVIDSLAAGGSERMLTEIVNCTDKSRYQVSVCVTRSQMTLSRDLNPGIPVYVLHRKSKLDPSGLIRLHRINNQNPVDIFHVHGRSSFSFMAFAKSIGIISSPIILHDHQGWIELQERFPAWLQVWGKNKLSYYVGVHPRMADLARNAGIDTNKITIIENAIDLSRFENLTPDDIRRSYNIPSSKKICVMVGGIRKQKGLDLLIDILRSSSSNNKYCVLVIGGINDPKYYQNCLEKIHQYNLDENFIFTGILTNIPDILPSFDFALMTSQAESGPVVLIEYLASGLPIVAFQTGEVSRHAAKLGVKGFVPSGNSIQFRNELEKLLCSSEQDFSEQSIFNKHIAANHFDMRNKIAEWHHLYQKIT